MAEVSCLDQNSVTTALPLLRYFPCLGTPESDQRTNSTKMSGPIQLEGYNTQLAAIVQSVLAVREHGYHDGSGAGPTGSWLPDGSSLGARNDPAEAHRLRESLLAHLSQLQTLLFLDEPSVFLQSLAKKVRAICLTSLGVQTRTRRTVADSKMRHCN